MWVRGGSEGATEANEACPGLPDLITCSQLGLVLHLFGILKMEFAVYLFLGYITEFLSSSLARVDKTTKTTKGEKYGQKMLGSHTSEFNIAVKYTYASGTLRIEFSPSLSSFSRFAGAKNLKKVLNCQKAGVSEYGCRQNALAV